ncbi:MAG: hypothetical protein DMG76_31465 [Acidobacteria bacterium]|nr:MAG: hypothetical protein DMG76_31465 [Acidobacteriota bacterium]
MAGVPGLFFYADPQLGAGLLNDLLSILLGELLVFLIALNGLLDGRDFVLRNIAALILALFPGVEVMERAVGSLAGDAEGAMLHALNLEDFFHEGLRSQRSFSIHRG